MLESANQQHAHTTNERLKEYPRQISSYHTRKCTSARVIKERPSKVSKRDMTISPTSVCYICECLCYQKGVLLFDVSKVHDVLQQHYHAFINDTQLSALLPNEEIDGSVHVSSRCMAFIKKGKIPPFATINNACR